MDRKYETGTERSGERRKIMLHPSYSDLMKVVNSEVEPGEAPVVNSRYSIVMATSKRARQIIGGEEPMVEGKGKKHLYVAVEEFNQGKIKKIKRLNIAGSIHNQELFNHIHKTSNTSYRRNKGFRAQKA